MTPRCRIAPSPTGPLHIGTARTALFNFLFARQHEGTFILRLEDTDQARSTVAYERDILDGLHWLGLEWDEGPEVAGQPARGPFGPYRQSERGALYTAAIDRLLAEATAPTPASARQRSWRPTARRSRRPSWIRPTWAAAPDWARSSAPPAGQRVGRPSSASVSAANASSSTTSCVATSASTPAPSAVTWSSPARTARRCITSWSWWMTSRCASATSSEARTHLSNTPKHVLLFRALGAEPPVFAHLPLILNPDRSKMSKRKSQTAIDAYRRQGYVREAIVNHLALLGWSSGSDDEVFGMDDLVARFDLGRVQPSGAIFDLARLDWLNGQWIRRLPSEELTERALPFLADALAAASADGHATRQPSADDLAPLLPMVVERLPRLDAIGPMLDFVFVEILVVEPALLIPKRWDATTTAEALGGCRWGHRVGRPRELRGGRARAAVAGPLRGPGLEGG